MPYYAIARGRQIGVVKSWKECQLRVQGYRGASYETFRHATDAYNFVEENNPSLYPQNCTKIYIDGAFVDGKCGYGVYFGENDPRNASVYLSQTSTEPLLNNQRAELKAMIHALQNVVKELNSGSDSSLYIILTDSQSTIKSLTIWAEKWKMNGWKTNNGSEVANSDLLRLSVALLDHLELQNNEIIRIEHVYGHAGVRGNAEADKLATSAAGSKEQGAIAGESEDKSPTNIFGVLSDWVSITNIAAIIAFVLIGAIAYQKRK